MPLCRPVMTLCLGSEHCFAPGTLGITVYLSSDHRTPVCHSSIWVSVLKNYTQTPKPKFLPRSCHCSTGSGGSTALKAQPSAGAPTRATWLLQSSSLAPGSWLGPNFLDMDHCTRLCFWSPATSSGFHASPAGLDFLLPASAQAAAPVPGFAQWVGRIPELAPPSLPCSSAVNWAMLSLTSARVCACTLAQC